jgi:N-acyl-D-aspartate/D-glutamate deacylase
MAVNGLLVRGGTVVDGTGAPGRRADVRVADDVIVEIGSDLPSQGERELDAGGATVAPGFIDSHTHFDPTLFWDPACDPMPQHGVTTVMIGNCSLSLAPLLPEQRAGLSAVFAYVEDMPASVFEVAVPWNWTTFPEYLDALRALPCTVNVAALVGHTPLRMYVMGDEAWERAATDDERQRMTAVLREALDAGAFGLSTSWFDEDADRRPTPSARADDDELDALLDVLVAHDALLEFIPDVKTGAWRNDVERVARLTRGRNLTSTFNGIFCDNDRPQRILEILDHLGELQASGVRMYPQVSPRGVDVRVNWFGGMSFYGLATTWHRVVQGDAQEKRAMLTDPAWRASARAEWNATTRTMFPHRHPDRVRLVEVHDPTLEPWIGRSLADLVHARGQHPSDVLADWLLENDLRPGVVGVDVTNADPDGVAAMLRHPAAVVSNSDAGAHLQMMCASGDTTLLLTRHVRERGDFTLEDAIWQLTGRQGATFGFADRGVLTPGARADITVFALDDLHWDGEEFVNDLPGGGPRFRRPSGGYRYTVTGGAVTQEDGVLTDARPGQLVTGARPR